MDVQDLDRIGFVTRHFKDLQGMMVLVPMGMMYVMQGLVPLIERLPSAWGAVLITANFVAAMLLMFGARRYYRSLLGEVEVRTEVTVSAWLPVLVLVVAALLYLFAKGSLSWLRGQCVVFGACLIGFWLSRECRLSQSHHLVLGGLLIGVGLFGLHGSPAAQSEVAYGVLGTSWILAGLLDHRQLVHTLGQLPPSDLDEAAAVEERR